MSVKDIEESVRYLIEDRVRDLVAAELRRVADEYAGSFKRRFRRSSKSGSHKFRKAKAFAGGRRRKPIAVSSAINAVLDSKTPLMAGEISARVRKSNSKIGHDQIVQALSRLYANKQIARSGSFGKYKYTKKSV